MLSQCPTIYHSVLTRNFAFHQTPSWISYLTVVVENRTIWYMLVHVHLQQSFSSTHTNSVSPEMHEKERFAAVFHCLDFMSTEWYILRFLCSKPTNKAIQELCLFSAKRKIRILIGS